MNSTKIIICLASVLVALVTIKTGYNFISSHWADIKELCIIAMVLGASFTVAFRGLKIRSGR